MALKQNKNDWFGPQLKKLRLKAKMTQVQIAERMEMSERNYRQWELGEVEPPLHKLPALARNLMAEPWMFFPRDDEWPASLADRPSVPPGALARIEDELENVLSEVRELRRTCP